MIPTARAALSSMHSQPSARTPSARKRTVQPALTAELTAVIDASLDSISTRPPKSARGTRHALSPIVPSAVTSRRRFASSAPVASGWIAPRIGALTPHAKLTNVMTVRSWVPKSAISASLATSLSVKQRARTVTQIRTKSSARSAPMSPPALSVVLAFVLRAAHARGVTRNAENVTLSPQSATSASQVTTSTKLILPANRARRPARSAPVQTSAASATKACTCSSIQVMVTACAIS